MRKYLYLLVGVIMILLFKEVGAIFAIFMVLAFLFEAFMNKTYSPWKRVHTKEDYSKEGKLKIDELNSLKK